MNSGNCQVRVLDLQADLISLAASQPQRYPYLLQSRASGTPHARYDILFAFPGETLRLEKGGDFLGALDNAWRASQAPVADQAVPFRGGWFVYLGYELAGQIEPALRLPVPPGSFPVAFATRIPAAIVRDHVRQQTLLVAEVEHAHLLDHLAADLAGAAPRRPGAVPQLVELREDDPDDFLRAVQRIKRYILEGDVFQVNLSRAWRGRLAHVDGWQLYRQLCTANPAPFAGLVHTAQGMILSSSPERLVRVRDGVVDTRPIAGTHPRNGCADEAQRAALIGHPKERAEHIMLIDLERNDLGRVCVPGSVQVDELMVLESFAHVHHIVSNVRGQLRPGTTPGEILRAVFPGGTITGCPKVRCMQIIAELEGVGRGPYTGAMGYLNRDGSMDFNILIRSLLLQGERFELRAGAGIVADSIPERELAETRAKAKGLLLALGAGA